MREQNEGERFSSPYPKMVSDTERLCEGEAREKEYSGRQNLHCRLPTCNYLHVMATLRKIDSWQKKERSEISRKRMSKVSYYGS